MAAQKGPSTNDVLDLLNDVEGSASLAVPGAPGTSVYGKSFALKKNRTYGGVFRITGTTIDVKVELEQSNYDLTAAEEGSAHTKWAVGATISSGITSSVARVLAVTPVATKYARLKLTGQNLNHADVALVLAELGIAKDQ